MSIKPEISWDKFEALDLRIGTIVSAESFPEARKPAYKLTIDFGDQIGIKKSSAQITDRYSIDELKGKQIIAVVNFSPKQIGPFVSHCLVMGVYSESGVVLLIPESDMQNGAKIG